MCVFDLKMRGGVPTGPKMRVKGEHKQASWLGRQVVTEQNEGANKKLLWSFTVTMLATFKAQENEIFLSKHAPKQLQDVKIMSILVVFEQRIVPVLGLFVLRGHLYILLGRGPRSTFGWRRPGSRRRIIVVFVIAHDGLLPRAADLSGRWFHTG